MRDTSPYILRNFEVREFHHGSHETTNWRWSHGGHQRSSKPCDAHSARRWGRLVVELNVEEATNLGNALQAAVALVKK